MKNTLSEKLFNQYATVHKIFLKRDGIDLSHCLSPVQIMLSYFNLTLKLVPQVKRTIVYSKEFKCPPHLTASLENISNMIEEGKNINGYLSLNIRKPKRHDYLLYDWGIHHLHFDNVKTPIRSKKNRSSELLFVFFLNSCAYFLDVKNHGNFCDIDFLNILDRNWPEITDRLCIGYSDDLDVHIPKEGILELRKAGVNTCFKLDSGKILLSMMLGGGITSSGDSALAMEKVLELQRNFDVIGHYIEKSILGIFFDEDIFFKEAPNLAVDQHGDFYVSDGFSRPIPLNSILERAQNLE